MIKFLFLFITKTKLWDWFLSNPMAHLKLRLIDYPSFPMEKYHEICEILKEPGHYTCVGCDTRSFSYKVNNLASGAKWAHAAKIIPGAGAPKILHSIVTGVCVWDLLEYLKEVDNFAIIKTTPRDEQAEAEADRRLNWMLTSAIGMPYDKRFDLGDREAFYCSELIYAIYEGLVDDPNFDPSLIADLPFFTPDNAAECGEMVFCHLSKNHSK